LATKEHSPAGNDSSIDVVGNQRDGARVTVRMVVALSWALITGAVGGWLVLSPWALGERSANGDWTSVATTEFVSGLGLVALAVACLAMVAVQVVSALAEKPAPDVGATPTSTLAEKGPPADSMELESTLIAVARALSADLASRELTDGRREQG
jgi:hypothetical protein